MSKIIEIATFTNDRHLSSQHVLAAGELLAPDYPRYRHGIGAIQTGQEARQEQDGPLVPGPWAFAYGLATCMDKYGGTGRIARENRAAGREHTVAEGTLVRIDGVVYRVRFLKGPGRRPGEFLELDVVAPLVG